MVLISGTPSTFGLALKAPICTRYVLPLEEGMAVTGTFVLEVTGLGFVFTSGVVTGLFSVFISFGGSGLFVFGFSVVTATGLVSVGFVTTGLLSVGFVAVGLFPGVPWVLGSTFVVAPPMVMVTGSRS